MSIERRLKELGLTLPDHLFASVLSERGVRTRAAFTPAQLPLNLAVELVVTAAILDS